MRAVSIESEEGRDLVDQEEKGEQKINEHLKLHTFSQEIRHEEKEEAITEKTSVLPAEKKEWRHSILVSQQGKEEEEDETEEVVVEKAESRQMETDGIMYDQTSPKENEMALAKEEVPSTKMPLSVFFSEN